jgi:putative toxin-antitoxin system antitoxin component (TIGR02293 family)
MANAATAAKRGSGPVSQRPRGGDRGNILGLKRSDSPGLIAQIEAGFPYRALQKLGAYAGLDLGVLTSLIGIPERTLARRKTAGRLSSDESERLLRISILVEKAAALFEGDVEAATTWLLSPAKYLQNQQPLYYARTEIGAREVEDLIGRLEHGVFS